MAGDLYDVHGYAVRLYRLLGMPSVSSAGGI